MTESMDRMAGYVATLGRGPGRSRPLTRAEAADAMTLLLDGAADPVQIGALLMLLRYRGEDPEEITGLVLAARARMRLPGLPVALDWPSYGAGRTRGAPWFLLAALALGAAGIPVLMHGTNEFSGGMTVAQALPGLGLIPSPDARAAARALAERGFAYVPVEALSPPSSPACSACAAASACAHPSIPSPAWSIRPTRPQAWMVFSIRPTSKPIWPWPNASPGAAPPAASSC